MPRREVLDRPAYLDRWSALHGGYDPAASAFVHGWLRLTYACAAPLARRGVSPDVLSLLGLPLALAVVGSALPGGRWALVTALLAVVIGLTDGLDGAVAVISRRTSRAGAVLDSVVDRVTDIAFAATLWAWGAPGSVAVAVGAATVVQEYARARAAAQGVDEIGVVTVWERSSRILVVAFCGVAVAAVSTVSISMPGADASISEAMVARLAAVLALGAAVVAALQLGRALRRLLQ